jgi:hypothetical protein
MRNVTTFMKYPGNNKHCTNYEYNPNDKRYRYKYIMPGRKWVHEKECVISRQSALGKTHFKVIYSTNTGLFPKL